ncbi:MAG: glycosyltransferase [Pirellulales bacterium]|nr:glycosyltransferase [Pirellulales bacterium]
MTPAAAEFDVDLGVIYTHEDNFMPPLLSTLAASGDQVRMRLLLVDNHSDAGAEKWRSHFPHVEILRNDRRMTYAENLNKILDASGARYVLLLNTDMFFEPEEQTIARMVEFMDSHPRCGLAGCRLYHPDGSYGYPARRFQTLRTIAARRLGLGKLLSATLRDHFYGEHEHSDAFACDWVSGCLLFVRRDAANDVGLLDESYRKYFEDVDYCLRMQQRGWQVMFNGKTYAWHWEQRASRRLWSADAWWHVRAYLRFLRKWGFSPSAVAQAGLKDNRPDVTPQRKGISRAA